MSTVRWTNPRPVDATYHRQHDAVGDGELVAAEAADHPVRKQAKLVTTNDVLSTFIPPTLDC